MSLYDWERNCAVVDRLNWYEYTIRTTTVTALALSLKDLYYIKVNWYAARARGRLPLVY